MLNPESRRGAQAIAAIDEALAREPDDNTLSCGIRALKPVLNFAFRYQAGYRASLSIGQFPPEEVVLRTALRVTPKDGEPAYFWQEHYLPPQPRQKNLYADSGGGFFVGRGEYEVQFLLFDAHGRECRKRWRFKLNPKGDERKLTEFVAAGEVKPLLLDAWKGTDDGRPRPHRVAIILHASPLFPRSMRLNSYDQSLLVTTLTSLLEDTPFRETSVHAVNLQQQVELFRTSEMDSAGFLELLDKMEKLELGTIDFAQLSKPKGHVDLLAELINEQLASKEPPDAIIFIGPNSRYTQQFPRELIEQLPASDRPQFFYLHLDYYSRWWPFEDTIEKLTESQGGKVFKIHHPKQFAAAIRKMEEILERR